MRRPLAVLLLLLAMGAGAHAQTTGTPESRLALGLTAYRAGDYASAITDLQASVNAGGFAEHRSLEMALVYLALAQMRMNREEDARDSLLRLHAAERTAPVYATLPLGSDAAEIEALAAALTPSNPLPRNVQQHAGAESTATSRVRREDLFALRSAETEAAAGRMVEATRIYSAVAGSPGAAREVLAAAAVGLYRTGAFREAAQAFRGLGTFAKGEEDLRYYYAISLFESGDYADAERELACALPFIQVTDDVSRYRIKIETMAGVAMAMARK
ncbi:MAG: tetratricopeptide repeat protein [Thermoanaerobaculia bacterium]